MSACFEDTHVKTLDRWAARRMGVTAPLTRAAVEAYQLTRIRETVAHARDASPFYRNRQGWPETPLQSFADVAGLPFTHPADLVRNDPPLLAVSQREVARIVTLGTSGTSGAPKRVHFTVDDIEATIDFFHHGMALFTRPGDRIAISFPGERCGSIGAGLALAAKRLGAEPIVVPPDLTIEGFVALLRAERPAVAFGAPVRLLAAARISADDGGPRIALRAALASSENLPPALDHILRELWSCEVFAHWGMTETGFGGALDCACHAGQHLRETDLYLEIVDPATGTPLPAGVEGEIVVTTLRRRGFPLVRYRTGDLGRLMAGACACGSVLQRLDRRMERLGTLVTLPDGGLLSLSRLDDALFGLEGVTDFTAVLDDAAPMRLALRVATSPAKRTPAVCEAVRNRVAAGPLIGPALASGSLRLTVDLAKAATCRHAGKRTLQRPQWPKAVLFDLDGTLVDSVPDVQAALNEALECFGMPPLALETVMRILGGGARRLVERASAALGQKLDAARADAIVARYLTIYRQRAMASTRTSEGARQVIQELAAAAVKLAVVTNRDEAETIAILKQCGLFDAMGAIVGGDAGPPKKPAPGLVLLACERLGVAAGEAVFVGDSEYDVDAARAAEMKTVVLRGGCSARGADNLGADRVIGDLSELPPSLWSLEDERRPGGLPAPA